MRSDEAATQSAAAISQIGSHFMLDGATYARGGELGFSGMDFYAGGRGGVLGDVDADVVAASLVFFNPVTVRAAWEPAGKVMPRDKAAQAWAECGYAWGEAHIPDDVDATKLAELAARVAAGASPAAAPVFAGWRALPMPDSPKAAALHACNALRELRMARHGAAVIAQSIAPGDAVRYRTPQMAPIFGWDDAPVSPEVSDRWQDAEAATNRAMAEVFAVLDDAERAELVELLNAVHASLST
jgi:hypothetical protein